MTDGAIARWLGRLGLLTFLVGCGLLVGCARGHTLTSDDGSIDADTNAWDAGRARDAGRTRTDAGPTRVDAGPGDGGICSTCATHDDCAANHYCVPLVVGGRACLPACIADLPDCPRSFSCVNDISAGAPEPICEPVGGPCCLDEDGDGYGVGVGCLGPDCDDADPSVHPGLADTCNSVDDDCDGVIDEDGGSETLCADGDDNDCDGLIDCADPDCAGMSCGSNGLVCALDSAVCECPSTRELCNGVDDDCDGTTDEGCPTSIGLGGAINGTSYGGNGGSAFTTTCPTGSALTGISIRAASRVDRVAGRCQPVSLATDTTGAEHTYSLATGSAVTSLPSYGGTGGSAYNDACGPGQVIIGIEGRSGSEVDRLSFICGTVGVTTTATVTQVGTSPSRGGTGGSPFSYRCPASRVAVGIFGRTGTRVDRIGLRCAPVTVTVR